MHGRNLPETHATIYMYYGIPIFGYIYSGVYIFFLNDGIPSPKTVENFSRCFCNIRAFRRLHRPWVLPLGCASSVSSKISFWVSVMRLSLGKLLLNLSQVVKRTSTPLIP